MLNAVVGFALVAGLMTITPGLDTALVLRAAITGGARAGYATGAGVSAGVLVWGIAAAVGVSALLTASQLAYDILRYAGAAYMVYLGVKLIWKRRPSASVAQASDILSKDTVVALGSPASEPTPETSLRQHFMRGFLTNLLNPKIGVFYVAVLPQFLPHDEPSALGGLVLASVHVVEGLVWFSLLILGSAVMRSQLQRPSVQAWTDRITGGVLIGFGMKVALDHL
jgi:threonine/homoserine/homoserine lactone efflux protein